MKTIIRRATPEDALGIFTAHMRSIREVCSKDYTNLEIAAWSGRNYRADFICQSIERDFLWVIESQHIIQGFGHFAVMSEIEGEVMGLYLTPEILGKGLGKKLFWEILNVARKHHLKKISLHATKTAKSFYEALGFLQIASDTSIEMKGVPIPCFPMELELNSLL